MKNKSHSDRFRPIQAKSNISTNYSGIFKTLCNPGIFRAVTYPEPLTYSKLETYSESWYIPNPGIFRTLAYSESKAYYSDIHDEAFCENS